MEHKKVAKKILEQLVQNITLTVTQGKTPDLYWDLENAIVDALKYTEKRASKAAVERTESRLRTEFQTLLKEYNNDGPTSN